jgi:hypothetical protein
MRIEGYYAGMDPDAHAAREHLDRWQQTKPAE